MTKHACLIASLVLLTAVAGCRRQSYPTARLEGAVTVDGRQVEAGTISFAPLEPGRGSGVSAAIDHGRYVANGVPRGNVRVYFNAVQETGDTVEDLGVRSPRTVNVIPDRHRAGMDIEVVSNDRDRNFELSSH